MLDKIMVHMCRKCGYISKSRKLILLRCYKCRHRMLPVYRRTVDTLNFFISAGIKVLDTRCSKLDKSGHIRFYLGGFYPDVFQQLPSGFVYIDDPVEIYNSLGHPPMLTITFVDGETDFVKSVVSGDATNMLTSEEEYNCDDLIDLMEEWADERDVNAIYCMLSLTHRL